MLEQVEHCPPFLIQDHRLSIDNAGSTPQASDGIGDRRIALAEVMPVACEQAHAGIIAPSD
jgi:hypothetical protein